MGMQRWSRAVIAVSSLGLVMASVISAFAGSAKFTEAPSATKRAGDVIISFAVDRPTDVTVAIVDAQGRVVRHLVAGMLGDQAPVPLQKGSLSQKVTWDGKDDLGRPVSGGIVRVSLGMEGRFHKIYGGDPQHLWKTAGVAVGPDGTLYSMSNGGLYAHRQNAMIHAFTPEGKHVRQIFPGPADLPAEKRKGWPRISLDDGTESPVVFHLLSRCTYPGAVLHNRNFPIVTRDGRFVVLSATPTGITTKHADTRGGRRLLMLGTDGSVPENWLGPEVCPQVGGFGHLALSPDEKHVYATGFVSTGKKGKGPQNVVYRLPLDGSTPSEIVIGKLYETEAAPAGLNDPQGIATDRDGNIYVGDYGNNRIAIFKPEGTFLDEIPIDHPDSVCVSQKTGAIYVVSLSSRSKPFTDGHYYTSAHNWRLDKVVKFPSRKEKTARAVYQNENKHRMGGGAMLALDESGEEPRLWIGGATYNRTKIVKLIDKGDRFEAIDDPIKAWAKKSKQPALPNIGDVAYLDGRVYTDFPAFGGSMRAAATVFDAETGEPVERWNVLKADGKQENVYALLYGEVVAGNDGLFYARNGKGMVLRYDTNGLQVPFASRAGKHTIEHVFHSHTRQAGLFVDRVGKIYVPCEKVDRDALAAMPPEEMKKLGLGRRLKEMAVVTFGADGKLIDESAVENYNARMGGIAVDSKGNIYLGAQAVPIDQRLPKRYVGKLPPDGEHHHPSYDYRQNATLFKFPPSGGGIVKDPDGDYTAIAQYKREKVSIKNAQWTRRLGYVGSHGKELGCHCETTRFDIDSFDRLFVPDIFRFRVVVLDSEGNELTHFGAYGNMDSRGPGSRVAKPEIPLGWPLSVECGDNKAFIADLVNRRVVGVEIGYATEATCEIQ